jgi:hypothetical protein
MPWPGGGHQARCGPVAIKLSRYAANSSEDTQRHQRVQAEAVHDRSCLISRERRDTSAPSFIQPLVKKPNHQKPTLALYLKWRLHSDVQYHAGPDAGIL